MAAGHPLLFFRQFLHSPYHHHKKKAGSQSRLNTLHVKSRQLTCLQSLRIVAERLHDEVIYFESAPAFSGAGCDEIIE